MKLDAKTAAMLQAIADMPDDAPVESIGELFQKFGSDLDPDAVAAFLKATGQQDRPEAKEQWPCALNMVWVSMTL